MKSLKECIEQSLESPDKSVEDQKCPECLPPHTGKKRRFGPVLRKLRNAISESVSWQALLDEAPMSTLDNRPVFIKSLIYSSEQASGFLKDSGKLLKCVWTSSGKCIQKRTEDEMQDLPITGEDSLKIKFK